MRTLAKTLLALGVPITALFEPGTTLEPADRCPVSLSGRCILDQLFVGRGRGPKVAVEAYSAQQLEVLRMCNLLLHTRDKKLHLTLVTLFRALLKASESRLSRPSTKSHSR